VVALARSLKLTVHAEGVETAEHDAFLLREGVDRMQGYFFGKPCDPQALEAMLARRNTPRLQAVA
jgi:EAL domain-containing protein (putative c-di-GMP-specific phosphodiesterase class I)